MAQVEYTVFRDGKWTSIEAFENMFGHHDQRINLPEWYTTDPQAEVMVFNEIPIRYIEGVAVENECDATNLKSLMNVSVIVRPKLFSWRSDFAHWRQFWLNAFPKYNDLVAPL